MSCPSTIIADWLRRHGQPTDQAVRLALVGLGANLPSAAGSPADTLEASRQYLNELSEIPALMSPVLTTRPLDCPPGSPDFCNAVAVILPDVSVTPMQLLLKLHGIEQIFGRQRSGVRNEARPLDLDLLAFGETAISNENLHVPHPRAMQREFVLRPLAQIWPDYRFPGCYRSVKSLLAALSDS